MVARPPDSRALRLCIGFSLILALFLQPTRAVIADPPPSPSTADLAVTEITATLSSPGSYTLLLDDGFNGSLTGEYGLQLQLLP